MMNNCIKNCFRFPFTISLSACVASLGVLFIPTDSGAQIIHGWDIGARAGLMWQSDTLQINGRVGANNLLSERYIEDNGWLGGLFVGYTWKDAPMKFGLDLALDWNGIDDPHRFHARDAGGNNYLVRARYKRDFFYGLSGRVGQKLSNGVLLFFRLGIERSTNELQLKMDNTNNPNALVRVLDKSVSRHKTGYLLGVGLDIPTAYVNTNLRLEYQYHICGEAEFLLNSSTVLARATYQPKAHFLTLGFQWGQV